MLKKLALAISIALTGFILFFVIKYVFFPCERVIRMVDNNNPNGPAVLENGASITDYSCIGVYKDAKCIGKEIVCRQYTATFEE